MDKPKNQRANQNTEQNRAARPRSANAQGTRTRRSAQASHMRQGAARNTSPRNASARNARPAQNRRYAAPPTRRKSHTGLIVGSVMSVLIVAFVVMVAFGIGPVGSAIRGSVASMFGHGSSGNEAQVQTANDTGNAKSGEDEGTSKDAKDSDAKEDERLDTLVLVNKEYAIPDGWEEKLVLKGATNVKGEYIEVDAIAFDAFEELRKDLLENEGITIELNSGYRSAEAQQEMWDYLASIEDEDYAREVAAEPGHSEHHTGLAIDALLVVDGEPIITQDEIDEYDDLWSIIYDHLAQHGFILRYLEGKEDITGYDFAHEKWHIRYVGTEAAQVMMKEPRTTLEEYLGKVPNTAKNDSDSEE